jgi:hypothetical protein
MPSRLEHSAGCRQNAAAGWRVDVWLSPSPPTVVIRHSFKLSVNHCPRRESGEYRQLHHEDAGPCIPAASTSCPGFHCRKPSQTPDVWLPGRLESCRFCVESCHFYVVSCRVTCTSLLTSQSLWSYCRTTYMTPIDCLFSVSVVIPSNSLRAAFVSLISHSFFFFLFFLCPF